MELLIVVVEEEENLQSCRNRGSANLLPRSWLKGVIMYHLSSVRIEFSDLNKRYRRLSDMLGRGASCQVIENLVLLDAIDYLSEKGKG